MAKPKRKKLSVLINAACRFFVSISFLCGYRNRSIESCSSRSLACRNAAQVVRPIRRATVAIQRVWLVKTNIRRFPTLLPISSSGLGWLSFSRYTRTEGTTDPWNPGIGATLFARCFFLAAALAVWRAWGARLDRFPHAPVASFFDSSPHMHVWVNRLVYESTHKQHARTARCVPSTHPSILAVASRGCFGRRPLGDFELDSNQPTTRWCDAVNRFNSVAPPQAPRFGSAVDSQSIDLDDGIGYCPVIVRCSFGRTASSRRMGHTSRT